MRRLLCKAFGHHRNAHGVRRSGTGWRSTCRICRQPLFRIAHGDWRLCSELEPAAVDQLEFLALLDRSPGHPRAPDQ